MNEGMDMRSRALIYINRIDSDKFISKKKIVRHNLPTLSASAHHGLHFSPVVSAKKVMQYPRAVTTPNSSLRLR